MTLIIPEVGDFLQVEGEGRFWVIMTVTPNRTIEGFPQYIGKASKEAVVDGHRNTVLHPQEKKYVSDWTGIHLEDANFAGSQRVKCKYIDKFEHELLKINVPEMPGV